MSIGDRVWGTSMVKTKINYLDFFKTVGKSKRLLRTGWVREKVKNPESVAEHSFGVGVLAMVLSDKFGNKLDKYKLIKMALLHDLAEIITGDIVAERGGIIDIVRREGKEQREREGIKKIFSKVDLDKEYSEIFDEMITGDTLEAKTFKQLDKLEMAIQALEYEEEQEKNLEEFFADVSLHVKDKIIGDIFDTIIKSRKKEYQASLAEKMGGKQ